MNKSLALLFTGLFLNSNNYCLAAQTQDAEISNLIQFLTSASLLTTSKEGQSVPLSYAIGNQDDIDKYFGDYICAPNNTCAVVDSLYQNPFAILGRGLPPEQGSLDDLAQAQAQIERADMKYGTDIYDAATWQIAIALAGKNNYIANSQAENLVNNQLQAIMNADNRATNSSFKYGYMNPITDVSKAFSFRMISTSFINKDPFYQGKYQQQLSWDYDPEDLAKSDPQHHTADYFKYILTWSDWKPITGENAWAQLLGPLQAEYLLTAGKISSDSQALLNALNSLDAFSAMQAGIGAFYYAPGGSEGNQGPIPQGEISIENNFSALGGLQVLRHILATMDKSPAITTALTKIDVMLNGGKTINGYQTLGLLSFLYNGAFDQQNNVFYTHGTAIVPSSTNDWQPDTSNTSSAMAIDVNTWGIAALGPETVDKWFGDGTALKIWQQVRAKGGYFQDNQLWGVGYTLKNHSEDGNGENIMSTEWTAGAINTVKALISYYQENSVDTSSLQDDLKNMQTGIKNLRNDQYLAAGFDGATPQDNFVQFPSEQGQSYLYASKRYPIPFGWNANTLPSTTSNAWVIMNYFNFNPFQYGGSLTGENYPTPTAVNISSTTSGLAQAVKLNFDAGDLGSITQLSLSYSMEDAGNQWVTAATINGREGTAEIPAGAKKLSIAFNNNGWAGACQVVPANLVCKDQECSEQFSVSAKWSADGLGACTLK